MLRMGEPERERSERLSQNHPLKPVEPGSEERAARVETTRQPKNRPDPKPPWFRHDLLADAREDAQPASPARDRVSSLGRRPSESSVLRGMGGHRADS